MSDECATKRELGTVKGRITKLERRLAEAADAPDLMEAYATKDRIAESDIHWGRQLTGVGAEIEKLSDNLGAQVEELRLALANLAVAAAETRRIADKCAELLGVRT